MEELLNIFKPTTPNYTAMFGRVFCGTFALIIMVNFNDQLCYFRTMPERIYGKPQKLLGKLRLPILTEGGFIIAGCVLIVSLIAVAWGVAIKPSLLAALVCNFIYFNSIQSLAYIQRKTNLAAFVLLILVVSASVSNNLSGTGTLWEIVLIKVAIAQMYFSAGLQKITKGIDNWINGRLLQIYLSENYLWSDSKPALRLAARQRFCAFLSICTLIFELSFWIVLVFPELTYLYVAGALLFHIGTLVTMRINYLKYLSPVYLVFFTQQGFYIKEKLGL